MVFFETRSPSLNVSPGSTVIYLLGDVGGPSNGPVPVAGWLGPFRVGLRFLSSQPGLLFSDLVG